MKIFIILSIIVLVVFYIVKSFFHSAKRDLFRDHEAWSGGDIKIKYSNSKGISESKKNDNYLKIIAEESTVYLDDQSKKETE